jgi:hypothetical protein
VSSYNDYLYDDILPGRNAIDGMWSNQITRRDGFLKLPAAQIEDAMSNTYLVALNLELHVPNIPIALFADAAYAPGHSISGANVQYDAGVMIPLLNNYFEVYFPLLASDGLIDPFDAYGKSISFIINLNGFNPFDKLRKLEL